MNDIPKDVQEHLRQHMKLIHKYGEDQLEKWEKTMGVERDEKPSHFPAARKMMPHAH